MASSFTSRLGATPNESVKAPVVVMATSNLTLSGEQTISGVAVVSGNRVGVGGQTTASQNGIYVASTGTWVRASDWDSSDDVVNGVIVLDVSVGNFYQASFSGSFTLDTTNVSFIRMIDDAADITYTPVGTGAVSTDVRTKLGEIVSVLDFGAVGDGVTDDTSAIQAALDTGKSVYFPAGTYKYTSTLDMVAGQKMFGEGFVSILQADVGSYSIQMAAGSSIEDIYITSALYPSSTVTDSVNYNLGSRAIKTATNNYIKNVRHTNCSTGIDCSNSQGVTIVDYYVDEVRHRYGWGAGVHCHSSYDVKGFGVFGNNCDRFIECETGSVDCHFIGGRAENIYPDSTNYVGTISPSYASYSFVLDAHSHENEPPCRNISYKNFYLNNCLNSIDAQLSTGTNDADCPVQVSFENIEIRSPRSTLPAISIDNAKQCRVTNVRFTGTTFTGTALVVVTGGNNKANIIDGLDVGSVYQKTAISVSGPNTKIVNSRFGNRVGTSALPVIHATLDADYLTVRENLFDAIQYSTAHVLVDSGASFSDVSDNRFIDPPSQYPTIAEVSIDSSDCRVSGNMFNGTTGLSIATTGARNQISNNHIYKTTGSIPLIDLDTGSANCFVFGNVLRNSTQTITDGGTTNTVINNRFGSATVSQTYAESNVTPDRTYDADATTLDELADVVGTLISDLRKFGIVK